MKYDDSLNVLLFLINVIVLEFLFW